LKEKIRMKDEGRGRKNVEERKGEVRSQVVVQEGWWEGRKSVIVR
jgi:hypothetical protein